MLHISENLTSSNSGFCQTLEHSAPTKILLTVPHDGLIAADFGFFKPRDKGPDGRRAIYGRDTHVWPIVRDIVDHADKDGVGIDAVRFLVPRMYVDANRALVPEDNLDPDTPHQTALDDPRLIPAYENYFSVIRQQVTRSIEAYGKDKILFIDCHGFGGKLQADFDLILGTANRTTLKHSDVDRQFAAAMREFGYRVFLPEKVPVSPQGDPFSAGHTTIHTARTYDIDAIQIEIANRFRTREGTEQGLLLAAHIASFLVSHYRPA